MTQQDSHSHKLEGRAYLGLGENLAERGTILVISTIIALATWSYRYDLLPILTLGLGICLTMIPRSDGRFYYQLVWDSIRDAKIITRDGNVMYEEPPRVGADDTEHPFDRLKPGLVVFEPTFEGEDTRVLSVLEGPNNTELILLRLDPHSHGVENMDADDRKRHDETITRFLTGCFNAGVLQVSLIAAQLPVDNTGTLIYLRETILFPEEVDQIHERLERNLSEASDVIVNRTLNNILYVAVAVNRREAWGARKRPQVVAAEDVDRLPLFNTLESVQQAARMIGYQADWLSPVEFAALLRSRITPDQTDDTYREAYQDTNNPDVTQNLDRSITTTRRLRPHIEVGDDWISCDNGFHRVLRMQRSEAMQVEPGYRDHLYRLCSEHGFISFTTVAELSPLKGQKWFAKRNSDGRQIVAENTDLYRPEQEENLRTSQSRLTELSTASRVTVKYEDMVHLWAPTLYDLDRVTKAVVDEHSLFDLPLKAVRGRSLQCDALLIGLGFG